MFRQIQRVLKKIYRKRKLLSSVLKIRSDKEVVVLVIWSSRVNTRTIQNLIYYLEPKYFVYLMLLNPVSWISFLMYLYPYKQVTIVPGFFLWGGQRKHLVLQGVKWGNAIQLEFKSQYDQKTISLPYFKHPSLCWPVDQIYEPHLAPRKGSVFFAGNVNKSLYNSKVFSARYKMPNRYEVYCSLRNRKDAVTDKYFAVTDEDSKAQIFVHTLEHNSLEGEVYTTYLKNFSFVICPPGVSMPLCHNLIEAISFGCIPVFSYPDWMPVGLEHGLNCFIYRNLDDLSDILDDIKQTDKVKIDRMRASLIKYFKENLSKREITLDTLSTLYVLNEHKHMAYEFVHQG